MLILVPVLWFAAAMPAPIAQEVETARCAGPVEISDGHILRVERNGVIVLTDGRAVRLEGIRLPAGPADRASSRFAEQALAAVAEMARRAPLALTSIAPKEDRYDRIRVQAFAGRSWLQRELLMRGLARVSIAPDRTECAGELFGAEAKARASRVGIWSSPAYAVRTPQSVGPDVGTFQIVEGTVLNANLKGGRAYLNFGNDWRGDFTVVIAPDDMKNFRAHGVDPRSYAGQTIRVRGMVQSLNGVMIEAANPQSIEVVQ